MVAKQVIFREVVENEDGEYIPFTCSTGGIAIYEDYEQGENAPFLELQFVICAECGVLLGEDQVEIIETLDSWGSLDEAIQNYAKPDGTRGFRIDNRQIGMKFD